MSWLKNIPAAPHPFLTAFAWPPRLPHSQEGFLNLPGASGAMTVTFQDRGARFHDAEQGVRDVPEGILGLKP